MKFYPYEKGGGRKKFKPCLRGGHTKFWGSFYVVARSFSHIKGGRKKFPIIKRWGAKSFTLS